MIICSSCGANNDIKTTYCQTCGDKLNIDVGELHASILDDAAVRKTKKFEDYLLSAVTVGIALTASFIFLKAPYALQPQAIEGLAIPAPLVDMPESRPVDRPVLSTPFPAKELAGEHERLGFRRPLIQRRWRSSLSHLPRKLDEQHKTVWAFINTQQESNGGFRGTGTAGRDSQHQVRFTALAMWGWLQQGSTPISGALAEKSQKAFDFLVSLQQEDGTIQDTGKPDWSAHCLATLAMAEAAMMEPRVNRAPLKKAIAAINTAVKATKGPFAGRESESTQLISASALTLLAPSAAALHLPLDNAVTDRIAQTVAPFAKDKSPLAMGTTLLHQWYTTGTLSRVTVSEYIVNGSLKWGTRDEPQLLGHYFASLALEAWQQRDQLDAWLPPGSSSPLQRLDSTLARKLGKNESLPAAKGEGFGREEPLYTNLVSGLILQRYTAYPPFQP